ncbi:carboxymuconolactone decarboxylase family protein [Geomesophilobacter sediminis]|uniref:Carboxymuconolactone decarboxylase family protein n=1 Tax=Geomesophilobacter sediminis TaxID=2798584 RepID=A0A8J7M3I6_9BACT|nr:carboxymuconolactone decarboxylase family protein [Geomesophilobacter sediminis]MBJ6727503.1 carboxymuconolactone decarboxylase family protein [Geomesophilobacter sediminis]
MAKMPAQLYLNLKERYTGLIGAVEAMDSAARSAGPLNDKTIHLIQLAAAAAIGSHGSVHSHTARALEAGATADEVRHAVIALTGTVGFPIMAAALSWVDEEIERT